MSDYAEAKTLPYGDRVSLKESSLIKDPSTAKSSKDDQRTNTIMLPYTEAVLLEVQRCASLVPLSVFHYTLAEAKLGPYTVPKSTTVFENIWAVHHDPKCRGDPDVFRLERFLNDEGKVQRPEYLIPFSVGTYQSWDEVRGESKD